MLPLPAPAGRHKYLKELTKKSQHPTHQTATWVYLFFSTHSLSLISLSKGCILSSIHGQKQHNTINIFQYKPPHLLLSPFQSNSSWSQEIKLLFALYIPNTLMMLEIPICRPFSCKLLLIISLAVIFAYVGFAKDQGTLSSSPSLSLLIWGYLLCFCWKFLCLNVIIYSRAIKNKPCLSDVHTHFLVVLREIIPNLQLEWLFTNRGCLGSFQRNGGEMINASVWIFFFFF